MEVGRAWRTYQRTWKTIRSKSDQTALGRQGYYRGNELRQRPTGGQDQSDAWHFSCGCEWDAAVCRRRPGHVKQQCKRCG